MSVFRSISGRLLIITIFVVMMVEVAIFVPSVARFREDYLLERVRRAEIAAVTVLAAPDGMLSPDLAERLIERTETLNIVMRHEGRREMILSSPELGPVTATYDLREPHIHALITDALAAIFDGEDGVIRVIATAPTDMAAELEVTLHSGPLGREMRAYGWRIFKLSLAISLVTALVIFLAVRRFVVGPLRRVVGDIRRFAENPEDPARIIEPSSGVGEVAGAEQALSDMEREVSTALKTRGRLAALGEAIAKINHDLRNILATTQLMADRLEGSSDPVVARTGSKLIASLDRAIRLCQSTLAYGRAEEPAPEMRNVALRALAEEVAEGLGIWPSGGPLACRIDIPAGEIVRADPEQLFRVLNNLMRNSVEALRAGGGGTVSVTVTRTATRIELCVADDGPGMPAKAIEHIFKPFQGGARRGGSGLGLAIAHELVRAHGGELCLVASTTEGTEFRISLPSDGGGAARADQEVEVSRV